jgi:SnoaL-like domain
LKGLRMNDKLPDELLIRRMVERWAVWRDAGDWERFATVWHPEGVMMATWFQGPFAEFIRVTQEGWAKGVSILHFLGGSAIELGQGAQSGRAIAQTKMTISQRGLVEGVPCDIVCTGRFYDFVVKHHGEWKLLHRQAGCRPARLLPRGLPAPRLHPDRHRLHGQAGHADAEGPDGRSALSPRHELARGRCAGALR